MYYGYKALESVELYINLKKVLYVYYCLSLFIITNKI